MIYFQVFFLVYWNEGSSAIAVNLHSKVTIQVFGVNGRLCAFWGQRVTNFGVAALACSRVGFLRIWLIFGVRNIYVVPFASNSFKKLVSFPCDSVLNGPLPVLYGHIERGDQNEFNCEFWSWKNLGRVTYDHYATKLKTQKLAIKFHSGLPVLYAQIGRGAVRWVLRGYWQNK